MPVDYQEAVQRWGRTRYGDDVTNVHLELGTEEDGYCDTCWYEYPVIKVSYIQKGIKHEDSLSDTYFGRFLQELLEAGQ